MDVLDMIKTLGQWDMTIDMIIRSNKTQEEYKKHFFSIDKKIYKKIKIN